MMTAVEPKLYHEHPAMFRNNPLGFALAVMLCFVLIGFAVLAIWWLQCRRTTLTVTEDRTTLKTGLLSKATVEILHRDVRNVQVSQGLLQKALGVGTIGVSSGGEAGAEILAVGIPDPENVRKLIERYRGQG